MPSPSSQENSASPAEHLPHFELVGAERRYNGTVALTDVNLRVRQGERLALVGPSGAGKTTLLRLLNAMERPSAGRVSVGGTDLADLPVRGVRRIRSRIGIISQDLSLVPNLRVSQNVIAGRLGQRSFFASLRAMLRPASADLESVHRILERVGIPEKLFDRTDHLSGGQRQRVAIARALFQEPEAILADEPVSAVDPARAEDTVRLLTEISYERGITLVMSIHNLDLARRYFPRLVGLRSGRIRWDGDPGEISREDFEELYRLDETEMLANGA